ncbi:MAG: molybdopterin-dependent oxidoreductase [Gammaproteobacteria bacterium]
MKKDRKLILRRTFLKGAASSASVILAGCSESDPPTYGNLLRMGDNLTFKAHRLLLPKHSFAREYDLTEITSVPAIGTTNPSNPNKSPTYSEAHGPVYEKFLARNFNNWTLGVTGSVERPAAFTLSDLKRMQSRTQVTRHTCEEGWSAIAQWTGVPMRNLLEAVGVKPGTRYVQLFSYDDWGDCIDMVDALHPQTIIAYGMNGRNLPISHGAPVRLRLEKQLGYKSMKFLRQIVVTEEFDDHGQFGHIQNGWSWYAGI